jgi:hypothetical protein
MNTPLTRDAILAVPDLQTEVVDVLEWGGSVIVGTMTGAVRDAWERSLVDAKGKVNMENIRARLVACTVLDENGVRMFSDTDIAALGNKSAAALDRCAKVAQRLNGLTADDLETAKGN